MGKPQLFHGFFGGKNGSLRFIAVVHSFYHYTVDFFIKGGLKGFLKKLYAVFKIKVAHWLKKLTAGTNVKGNKIIAIRILCKNLVAGCVCVINCGRNKAFKLQRELCDKGTKGICIYNIRAGCKIIVMQLNNAVRVFFIPGFRQFPRL